MIGNRLILACIIHFLITFPQNSIQKLLNLPCRHLFFLMVFGFSGELGQGIFSYRKRNQIKSNSSFHHFTQNIFTIKHYLIATKALQKQILIIRSYVIGSAAFSTKVKNPDNLCYNQLARKYFKSLINHQQQTKAKTYR